MRLWFEHRVVLTTDSASGASGATGGEGTGSRCKSIQTLLYESLTAREVEFLLPPVLMNYTNTN